MFEEERRDLISAAEELEALAAETTGGEWRIGGLLATRPEIVTHFADGSTEHIADARANTAGWIAALSPLVAAPLAAWLRSAANDVSISPHAVALARALVSRRND